MAFDIADGAFSVAIASDLVDFRQYSVRLALLIFADPWGRLLQLQEELMPWTFGNVLQVMTCDEVNDEVHDEDCKTHGVSLSACFIIYFQFFYFQGHSLVDKCT